MGKRVRITLAALLLAVVGVIWWLSLPSPEPAYQGKRLTEWLDEYNRAGSMERTEPVSDAIRAMGTNCLPFLLAHINHTDSPIKRKIVALVQKEQLVKLPFYGEDPHQCTSILALHALGSQAAPLCPELLPIAQDSSTRWLGMLSLLAIGTNSIPTLERVCQSTNVQVRERAVLMMAIMKAMPAPWFSWGWSKAPINRKPLFHLGWAVSEEAVREIVKMLAHPDPAVRRASADALGLYTRTPYTAVARSAVPLLLRAVQDSNREIRRSAAATLKAIDHEAAAKAGI